MQDKGGSLKPGWEVNKMHYCYCCPDYFYFRCISTVGHTCGGSGASKNILAFLSLDRRGMCRSLEHPSSSLCMYGFFSGSLAWISIRQKVSTAKFRNALGKKLREIKKKVCTVAENCCSRTKIGLVKILKAFQKPVCCIPPLCLRIRGSSA